MKSIEDHVLAILEFVKDNAPTMPDLHIQRIGLIVGFDPDEFPEDQEEYSTIFQHRVREAAKKVLSLEKIDCSDIKPYLNQSD